MRVKRVLKITGITVLVIVVLLVLFVAAFIFNPFEGSLPDIRGVVPRDVDFYVRKQRIGEDFAEFPEPHFWEDLSQSADWEEIKRGPTGRDLNQGQKLDRMFADAQDQVVRIRDQSSGFLDPLRDVLGTDVVFAGKFGQHSLEDSKWCMYARVTWRMRFAWGLMQYGFVQEEMRKGGLAMQQDGEIWTITPQNGAPMFVARYLDCLMVANDADTVKRSLELARGIGDTDAFESTSTYQDGIQQPLAAWEEKAKDAINAIELFARPGTLFERTTWDDNWPDAKSEDMNTRVLASFLNLKTWRFLTGSLIFEDPNMVSILGEIELNQNNHSPFQRSFFKAEAQQRKDWLDDFVQMVPAEACAAAALRVPAGDFLREIVAALEQDDQVFLNERIGNVSRKYRTLDNLIGRLETALLPRTGFVFRKQVPDTAKGQTIKIANPSPTPHTAWVFWLREDTGGRKLVNDFLKELQGAHKTVGFDQAFHLRLGLGGDVAVEFAHPQIPGTGSIAMAVWDRFLFLSNSGPFIQTLAQTKLGRQPALRDIEGGDFEFFDREIKDRVNGVILLNGPELERVLQDYELDVGASLQVRAQYEIEKRSVAEGAVFKRKYAARHTSISALPANVKTEFDKDVNRELTAMWQAEKSSYDAQSKAGIREAISFVRLFKAAYLQVTLDPRHLRLQGTAVVNFR